MSKKQTAGLKGKRMMKQVCQEQKSESRQIFLAFTNRNVSSVQKDKYVRSSNSRKKLVKVTQLRVDETLRNIAERNAIIRLWR